MADEDFYEGRLQTEVKHQILEAFLLKMGAITGKFWSSITYIDGFSGPWKTKDPSLSDTSFSIALRAFAKVRNLIQELYSKSITIRYFFIEENSASYANLSRFAEAHPESANIRTEQGKFEDFVDEILTSVEEDSGTFPFAFIDPTGWKGYSMTSMSKLLGSPKNFDVIINFMIGHLFRFVLTDENKQDKSSIEALYGDTDYSKDIQYLVARGLDIDEAAVRVYCERLKKRTGAYVCRAIILKQDQNRAHFNLVFASKHLRGITAFKETEKSIAPKYEKKRAKQKDKEQTGFLFPEAEPTKTGYFGELRDRFLLESHTSLELMFDKGDPVSYDAVIEEILQIPYVWLSDVNNWLAESFEHGKIKVVAGDIMNHDATKLRKKDLKINRGIVFAGLQTEPCTPFLT